MKISAFNPAVYNPEVAAILALDGRGARPMPLAGGRCSSEAARCRIQAAGAEGLFPQARAPQAALAGLYLYFTCMDEAHTVAQDVESAEGSFWHGIVHRREPDAGNAAYWFGRVGAHPIFPGLREAAATHGMNLGARWDPFAFIDRCERARKNPGSAEEQSAMAVQLAEWQLLFDYCAGRPVV